MAKQDKGSVGCGVILMLLLALALSPELFAVIFILMILSIILG